MITIYNKPSIFYTVKAWLPHSFYCNVLCFQSNYIGSITNAVTKFDKFQNEMYCRKYNACINDNLAWCLIKQTCWQTRWTHFYRFIPNFTLSCLYNNIISCMVKLLLKFFSLPSIFRSIKLRWYQQKIPLGFFFVDAWVAYLEMKIKCYEK